MGGSGRGEQRINELFWQAAELQQRGRSAEALAYQEEALALLREQLAAAPVDALVAERTAAMLYGIASSYTGVGRPDAAVEALEQSEQLYGHVRELTGKDVTVLLADVGCRKASALSAQGKAASAILTMDEAIETYYNLGAHEPASPLFLDLARVVVMNGDVLRRHGDPDLAVVAADAAIRCYLMKTQEINGSPQQAVHLGYFYRALDIAADLHARHGRIGLALEVDEIELQAAGDPAAAAAAQARKALHLRLAGRGGEAEQLLLRARATTPDVVAQMETDFAQPSRVTLRVAVDAARRAAGDRMVPAALDDVLADPADPDEARYCVTARCPDGAKTAAAAGLARAAQALAAAHGEPAHVWALRFEAHLLFAVASRSGALRYDFGTHGETWAAALLELTRQAWHSGAEATANDLADWLRGVLVQLHPHSLISPTAKTVFDEAHAFVQSLPRS